MWVMWYGTLNQRDVGQVLYQNAKLQFGSSRWMKLKECSHYVCWLLASTTQFRLSIIIQTFKIKNSWDNFLELECLKNLISYNLLILTLLLVFCSWSHPCLANLGPEPAWVCGGPLFGLWIFQEERLSICNKTNKKSLGQRTKEYGSAIFPEHCTKDLANSWTLYLK